MAQNKDSLFTDERNLLLAKAPRDKGAPFEYIFLHDDEKKNLRFVASFNHPINCFKICKLEEIAHQTDLLDKWDTFFKQSSETKKRKQPFFPMINGNTWKRIHIQGSLLNTHLFNSFEEFRNNVISQSNFKLEKDEKDNS